MSEMFAGFDVRRHLNNVHEGSSAEASVEHNIVITEGIVIAQEWRASGLARIMVDHRLTLFRNIGAVLVLTVATNPRVQHMLKSIGFEVVREIDFGKAVKIAGGEWTQLPDDPKSVQLMMLKLCS